MKKIIFSIALILFAWTVKSQDMITKTDGTVIKGKVVSFQNDRLVIMQEDETEMALPRKAISEIKFNWSVNKTVTSKSITPPQEAAPASYSVVTPPKPQKKEEPARYEAPIQVAAPQPITSTKNTVNSPGEIVGLDNRILVSASSFKEKAVGVGRIAVTICLNTEGGVISAKFRAAGSTTLDSDLISMAVQNARELKFSKGDNGECGIITYKFNLD